MTDEERAHTDRANLNLGSPNPGLHTPHMAMVGRYLPNVRGLDILDNKRVCGVLVTIGIARCPNSRQIDRIE